MKILGIDPGLNCTGWGIVGNKNGEPGYIDCGVITTKVALNIEDRLVRIHKGILEVIEKYKPKEVALEKVFVNTNAESTLKLGEARGVLLMTPALMGLKVAQYSPNTIKKNVTGLGHASKDQVQKMVQLILSKHSRLHPKQDAVDAIAIALCHYYYLKL